MNNNLTEKSKRVQYSRAKGKVAKWEKRYPNRPDIVTFLVKDDYLNTRQVGRKQYYREYLSRPKQLEWDGLPHQALPIQPEIQPELDPF